MGNLEKVIAYGFSTLMLSRHALSNLPEFKPDYNNIITCRDGYQFSAIAGPGAYCIPRPSSLPDYPPSRFVGETEMFDYPGPYTALEIGYPSDRPEPWEPIDGDLYWKKYAEDEDTPCDTVYPYTPIQLVRALARLHGGEENQPLPESLWTANNGPGRYRAARLSNIKQLNADLAKLIHSDLES